MTTRDFNKVGFIGLGAMGKHMVEHLATNLPNESRIFVYDISSAPIDDLVSRYPGKVIRSVSPKDVTENSTIMLSMVPEGKHVNSVYLTPETGVTAAPLHNKLLIDCSTIDIATSLSVRNYIATHHPTTSFYDAPVSGGTLGAKAGTIAFFLGCAVTDENLPCMSKLLRLMGTKMIPCGGPGSGLAAKLCNNYLSGLIAIASSESLNMGIRAGLDPRVLNDVIGAGTAANAICADYNPCPGVVTKAPASKGYEGGFKVELMKKDFGLAVELATGVGANLVLGEKALETYTAAAEDPNCRGRDSRVVYRFIGGDEKWRARFGG
ncbi:NAD binding domain of 6-phosphogluconate dehydrogenase-domain-containing protein [Penicillium robsamsonii]|uniref:NAD binding domain of 6-phosphogluconate dehydrogenase-domain-containing protein n=1 Tax=Penicillium robsamsonii TaxID=1792511 RepID=UPI0025490BCF|nr:NAD binding domain of 6-phosphogluconate dehydrogenase-domain-containing protein [Penicillium robsamsonii]KAJ5817117.1 NAD binding domain of 6-phosphogluconate dehydrogenase-domain-containing protein [Penicillium robsamsonii]